MMKNKLVTASISLVILLAALLAFGCKNDGVVNPTVTPTIDLTAGEQAVINSSSDFGIDLFKRISAESGNSNVIISPLSITTAFGMALNGAHGSTLDQMKNTLGVSGLELNSLNTSAKNLFESLTSVDNSVLFKSANSIWYDNNFDVLPDFLTVNQTYFNAVVSAANFASPATLDLINNWVKASTNNKIEKILDEISADKVMFLINAIYFKAPWKNMFDKNLTADRTFNTNTNTTLTTPFMVQTNNYKYFANQECSAVELPYGSKAYRMMIVLPGADKTADNIIAGFSKSYFENIKAGLTDKDVTVYMPKFKLSWGKMLNEYLKSMGMTDAFKSGIADFRLITAANNIYISEVRHKTFIEVNEEGTEAAGVTSIGFSKTSIDPNEVIMNINRPFIFVIYENSSNAILFIGKINNPTEAAE